MTRLASPLSGVSQSSRVNPTSGVLSPVPPARSPIVSKVSLSVNPDMRLFEEGTDPDDVRRGAFADSWLLSALSMISAATVGDGRVDEQVKARPELEVPSRHATPNTIYSAGINRSNAE